MRLAAPPSTITVPVVSSQRSPEFAVCAAIAGAKAALFSHGFLKSSFDLGAILFVMTLRKPA